MKIETIQELDKFCKENENFMYSSLTEKTPNGKTYLCIKTKNNGKEIVIYDESFPIKDFNVNFKKAIKILNKYIRRYK